MRAREDVVARIREETEGRGADAVLLAVGGNALIPTAIEAARPGGRIMLFAQTQHGQANFDPAVVCMDEKTLMGSYSSSAAIQEEGVRIVVDGLYAGLRPDAAHFTSVSALAGSRGDRVCLRAAPGFHEDHD